jgi:hypothetical protein
MTLTNSQVADAFWKGQKAHNKSMTSEGDKLFSYWTVILQRLPDGKIIGNETKYSNTTSRHQSEAWISRADILLDNIPRGTNDLKNIRR